MLILIQSLYLSKRYKSMIERCLDRVILFKIKSKDAKSLYASTNKNVNSIIPSKRLRF